MKKRFFLILSLMVVCMSSFMSCSNEDEREVETPIQIEDLPSEAQEFLDKYFNDEPVKGIQKEEDGNVIVYVVDLENGFEIVFNAMGEWQQVDAPNYMTVPTAIIPEQVMQTLNERFSGYKVREINTDGEGWKVELSTSPNNEPGSAGIDIWFDMSGEIIRTSQDNV